MYPSSPWISSPSTRIEGIIKEKLNDWLLPAFTFTKEELVEIKLSSKSKREISKYKLAGRIPWFIMLPLNKKIQSPVDSFSYNSKLKEPPEIAEDKKESRLYELRINMRIVITIRILILRLNALFFTKFILTPT
jgi:hypothetical protein